MRYTLILLLLIALPVSADYKWCVDYLSSFNFCKIKEYARENPDKCHNGSDNSNDRNESVKVDEPVVRSNNDDDTIDPAHYPFGSMVVGEYMGVGKVTTYYSFPWWHCPKGNINCSGNSFVTASSYTYKPWQDEEKFVACDRRYHKMWDKLLLVDDVLWSIVVTCVDVWSAIKWPARLDLWVWVHGNLSRTYPTTFYDVEVYRIK